MTNIMGLFYRYNLHRCITIQVKSYLAMLPIFTILIFSYKKLIISLFIYQILILIIPFCISMLQYYIFIIDFSEIDNQDKRNFFNDLFPLEWEQILTRGLSGTKGIYLVYISSLLIFLYNTNNEILYNNEISLISIIFSGLLMPVHTLCIFLIIIHIYYWIKFRTQ